MSDIKQKFDPSTHMTRCGQPWEKLPIDLGHSMETVIKSKEPSCAGDFILWITTEGHASNRAGHRWESFDLIPIIHKLVDLPTNLREEIRYSAWSSSLNDWVGYSSKPIKRGSGFCQAQGFKFWQLDCFSIPCDPAGPENSLHIRTDNGWERCSE